ncbi:MAG: hypothetical protein V4580_19165 [Bacteroidota bacterium]
MKNKFTLYLVLATATLFAQLEIDTLPNGIIIENNFPKHDLPGQKASETKEATFDFTELTPFAPKLTYETIGIKARILPWLLGNSGGFNYLLGVEFGFLKNHSISIDGMHYGTQDHRDHYFGENDPRNRESDDYYGRDDALYFSYNYYYNLKTIREGLGVALYTGLNYRAGRANYTWDRGISKDSILQSSRNYYSYGPQLGLIIKWGERKHFAINVNVAALYSTKNISEQRTDNLVLTTNHYHLNSYDLKVGLNLYWWFIRKRHKP